MSKAININVTVYEVKAGRFQAHTAPEHKHLTRDQSACGHGRSVEEAIEDYEHRTRYNLTDHYNAHTPVKATQKGATVQDS